MAFCRNCGQQLLDESKFCHKCGNAVYVENNNESTRKMVYDGEIHKCPNCGEVLESFTAICPQCGFELRGARAANSVREFALKLEEIEAQRDKRFYMKTNEQKNTLIRSFIIPNNKEDILEFIILASTNIDVNSYKKIGDASENMEIKLADSWLIKIEQAYQKAKITFGNDLEFKRIEELYNHICKRVKRNKRVPIRNVVIIISIFVLIIAVPLIMYWYQYNTF